MAGEFIENMRVAFNSSTTIMLVVGAAAFALGFVGFIGAKLAEASGGGVNWTEYSKPINDMWGPTATIMVLAGIMLVALPAAIVIMNALRSTTK